MDQLYFFRWIEFDLPDQLPFLLATRLRKNWCTNFPIDTNMWRQFFLYNFIFNIILFTKLQISMIKLINVINPESNYVGKEDDWWHYALSIINRTLESKDQPQPSTTRIAQNFIILSSLCLFYYCMKYDCIILGVIIKLENN